MGIAFLTRPGQIVAAAPEIRNSVQSTNPVTYVKTALLIPTASAVDLIQKDFMLSVVRVEKGAFLKTDYLFINSLWCRRNNRQIASSDVTALSWTIETDRRRFRAVSLYG